MQLAPSDIEFYSKYLTPPVIGAFIGYITNKVAIKMLFRPLKKWHFLGIPLPMTPGVIPAKRKALAKNMGEMVGDQLLTSDEIKKGLQAKKFQDHLLKMIEEKVGSVMQMDLDSLPNLIPTKFSTYFDLAVKTIKYQIKESIHTYLLSSDFQKKLEQALRSKTGSFFQLEVATVIKKMEKNKTSPNIDDCILQIVSQQAFEEILTSIFNQQLSILLEEKKPISSILPVALCQAIETELHKSSGAVLAHIAEMLDAPEKQEVIVAKGQQVVEAFLDSLGPMSAMAKSFVTQELVESSLRKLLAEKKEDIRQWMLHPNTAAFVGKLFSEQFQIVLQKSASDFVSATAFSNPHGISTELSQKIAITLKNQFNSGENAEKIKSILKQHISEKKLTLADIVECVAGSEGTQHACRWIEKECLELIRAKSTMQSLDTALESMLDGILNKKIGKLTSLLPSGVRDSISQFLHKMSMGMLEREVPGLVESLHFSRIVSEKIDTLDLLKLESLLLSIMEEQFKYINLFGALLGFVIGLGNVFFVH